MTKCQHHDIILAMGIGETVKEYRLKRGLSQGELAKLAEVDRSYISRIERGDYKFTSPETLKQIARALKIKPHILFDVLFETKGLEAEPPKSLQDLSLRELQTNIIEIPIVAELHMPGEIIEYAYIVRPRPGHVNFVGVQAKGYCLEPEIKDGDTLIIDKDAVPEPGHTILCYHNGSQHPRLIKFKQSIDLNDCDIYGVVIGINRRL